MSRFFAEGPARLTARVLLRDQIAQQSTSADYPNCGIRGIYAIHSIFPLF
jgi:hypothetical protein